MKKKPLRSGRFFRIGPSALRCAGRLKGAKADAVLPKYALFRKMVGLIVVLLLPILALYVYSNRTSTDVLADELTRSNMNQLLFFQSQVDADLGLMTLWPNLLIQDPDISDLRFAAPAGDSLSLDEIERIKRIQTKLRLQESSSDWTSRLLIYSPALARVVSSYDVSPYNPAELAGRLRPGWQIFEETDSEGKKRLTFSLMTSSPYTFFDGPQEVNLIVEVRFGEENIASMLDRFKSDGRRDPFFYRPDAGVVYNRTADRGRIDRLVAALAERPLPDRDSRTVELDGARYLVHLAKSKVTGWYLIDYVPLSDILRPIARANMLFYGSVAGLLLMSSLVAYMLYAQVQIPVKQLVSGFQRLKNGDYAVRLAPKGNSEFRFVFDRFNSMVAQIEELFSRVYLEQIHAREARLKQLQSQINPHFFYNCFNFISSMAKLGDTGTIVAMTQNLARYYRYTTRQERDLVALDEELEFVRSYLEIQALRMKRLKYEIRVPSWMGKLLIPPLSLQPLVENAVLHGVEPSASAGLIRIAGETDGRSVALCVEDDGKGMSKESITALEAALDRPMDERSGCGLWNVHQRLKLRFGTDAGVKLGPSALGGLRAMLRWPLPAVGEVERDDRSVAG